MKIYTYLFFLAVGLFMMTAAMCNKQSPKPTRPVFEADTTGTGGSGGGTGGGGTGGGGGGTPTKAKVTIFVEHESQPGKGVQDVEVAIGRAADKPNIEAGNPTIPTKMTGSDGKVIFEDLEPATDYHIFGEIILGGGETHDNYNTGYQTPVVLTAGDNYKEITVKKRQ